MIPLLQGLQVFVLKARTVFFDGRIPLNRDGSSRVRKTPIAAGSRWIVPERRADITRFAVSSRGAGARLPS